MRLGGSSLKNAKTAGTVNKTFEKQVKGYVFMLDANSSCKVQFPKEDKTSLGLLHQYLVLQIYIPKGKNFTLEVAVADSAKVSRL